MIGANQLPALLPLIVLAAATVAVMLAIAFRRDHGLAFALTVAGLIATLLALPAASGLAPQPVTALLIVDRYSLFFTGLASACGLAVVLLCPEYLRSRSDQPEEFYLLVLTLLLGAAVLAASSHFASFFLGLEILTVSLFPLIAYRREDKHGLEAGMKYLVLSGVSSALLLFGMALIYAETGVLAFAAMQWPAMTLPVVAGIALIVAAVGFKLSLVPFHLWTADVYQGAPAPAAALLATVSKGAVFALLLRYGTTADWAAQPALGQALGALAAASMLAGNLLALKQDNLKRMLGYSSIAHMGYLLLAVLAAHRIGTGLAGETLGFYLAAYAASTVTAFGVLMALSPAETEADALEDYTGLFWRHPGLAAAMTAALLSLAGIPLTAGFIGKFYLFLAGSEGGLWLLLAFLIAGSGIGLYYYLRVVFVMSLPPVPATGLAPASRKAAPAAGLVLVLLVILLIGLGMLPAPFMEALLPVGQALR